MLTSYPAGTTRTFSPSDNEGCDTDLIKKFKAIKNVQNQGCLSGSALQLHVCSSEILNRSRTGLAEPSS